MYPRLNNSTIARLAPSVARPQYDPSAHKPGIVHLGIGAFHRGHQAVFTDEALAQSGGDWRITAVSLRSPNVSQQMNPQDCLYTVTVKSDHDIQQRLIASIAEVLVAPEDPAAVLARLASTATKIVTLTVTEKGYHFDTVNNCLNMQSSDIQHDLSHPQAPRSMPGYLVAACELRKQNGAGKLTVISCDNLPENGEITRTAVMTLAQHQQPELAQWIDENVSFCSSMVDRIVPPVSDAMREELSQQLLVNDQALIVTEPFSQWVIEDKFNVPRPAWDKAGVLLVDNVSTYEKLKLRTLNGSHSALAYAGGLMGYQFIHETMQDELLVAFVTRMMKDEMQATLSIPDGFDITGYQQQVRDRFANSHIRYATKQVATDGSQKILQRLLYPAMDLIQQNKSHDCIIAVLVCWLKFLGQKDEKGREYPILDPLSDILQSIAKQYLSEPEKMLKALYAQTSIFPKTLENNPSFNQQLVSALTLLNQSDVKSLLAQLGIGK